jgi:hypothetical protein
VTLVILLVLAVAVLAALLTPGPGDKPLDPDSAGPTGSRAVAEILRAHGVVVTRVATSAEALRRTDRVGPVTLVVVRTENLGPDQLAKIKQSSARLVVVQPDQTVLDGLGLADTATAAGVVPARPQDPGCTSPTALAAGRVTAGGHLYTPGTGSVRSPDSCYPGGGSAEGWSFIDGYLADHDASVIGQSQILMNKHLAEQGNAALALRTLGRDPRVVWYLPDPFETNPDGVRPGLRGLLPAWVPWVIAELAVATLVAIVWRGRRLGALVTEPLPVVVRSAETLEGRASLYRRAHARDRAAATLRTATLRRLARRLDLPRDTPPAVAAEAIGEATGRSAAAVRELLLGAVPVNDAALVTLARDLDALEEALRTKGSVS